MKRRESIVVNIAIALVSVLLSFLFCEWAWREFSQDRVSPLEKYTNQNLYRLRPYVGFSGKPFDEIQLDTNDKFNSLGYRGELPTLPKPSGEFRILVYGGSTVLGHKRDIVSLLQEELIQRGHSNIKTYNFGVVASVSGQTLSRIVHEGIDFRPDLVLVYNGVNDLNAHSIYDPRPGYPFNFMINENNPIYHSSVESYPTLALVLYGSQIFRDLFPNYFQSHFARTDELRASLGHNDKDLAEARIHQYFVNMRKMNRISSGLKIDFLWVLQPHTALKDHKMGDELNFNESDRVETSESNRLALLDFVNTDPALKSNFYDESNHFDSTREQIFYDDCHVLDEKKPLVARMLADILEQRLR